jgi:ATP-binding cassette subfamily B (MDR/TAP) protein 1
LIRDPKVLLLDEATSSLDSESERLVQAAFERAGKGRTMVVVAHRLATVQNADVIFVLGDGKVLETGDHNTLLRKRGVYYQMVSNVATPNLASTHTVCMILSMLTPTKFEHLEEAIFI